MVVIVGIVCTLAVLCIFIGLGVKGMHYALELSKLQSTQQLGPIESADLFIPFQDKRTVDRIREKINALISCGEEEEKLGLETPSVKETFDEAAKAYYTRAALEALAFGLLREYPILSVMVSRRDIPENLRDQFDEAYADIAHHLKHGPRHAVVADDKSKRRSKLQEFQRELPPALYPPRTTTKTS